MVLLEFVLRLVRGLVDDRVDLVGGLVLDRLAGYWIFHGLFGIGDTDKFDWGGIIGAIIGAMIVVALASFLIKRFAKRETV